MIRDHLYNWEFWLVDDEFRGFVLTVISCGISHSQYQGISLEVSISHKKPTAGWCPWNRSCNRWGQMNFAERIWKGTPQYLKLKIVGFIRRCCWAEQWLFRSRCLTLGSPRWDRECMRIHTTASLAVPSSPKGRRDFGVVAARSTFPWSLQVPKEEKTASGGVRTGLILSGFTTSIGSLMFIGIRHNSSLLCTSHLYAMVILGSIWLGSNHARAFGLSRLGARSSDRFKTAKNEFRYLTSHIYIYMDILVLHDDNMFM